MAEPKSPNHDDHAKEPNLKGAEFCGVGTFADQIPTSEQKRNHGCASPQSDLDDVKPCDPPARSFGGVFKRK